MNAAPVKRSARVAEQIRAELMDLVLTGGVKDPRVQGAVVTDVRVTDDLRFARVYVRLLEQDPPGRRQRELVEALGRAGGFLRREIGSRLRLKFTPELRFAWDETIDHAARIEEVLDEIRSEEDEDGEAGP